MAGAKGGGSWKVAYADFVTAMMAFFLVMWIGAQDAKTRQSVANYFVDPSGAAKKPVQPGAILDHPGTGSVPKEQSSDTARGQAPATEPGEFSPPTKMVADWLARDPKRLKAWREAADSCRTAAAASAEVRAGTAATEAVAIKDLAVRLRVALTEGSPAKANDVYQDLFLDSLRQVNWEQLAEGLVRH